MRAGLPDSEQPLDLRALTVSVPTVSVMLKWATGGQGDGQGLSSSATMASWMALLPQCQCPQEAYLTFRFLSESLRDTDSVTLGESPGICIKTNIQSVFNKGF